MFREFKDYLSHFCLRKAHEYEKGLLFIEYEKISESLQDPNTDVHLLHYVSHTLMVYLCFI